jgi:hypothetical protein
MGDTGALGSFFATARAGAGSPAGGVFSRLQDVSPSTAARTALLTEIENRGMAGESHRSDRPAVLSSRTFEPEAPSGKSQKYAACCYW